MASLQSIMEKSLQKEAIGGLFLGSWSEGSGLADQQNGAIFDQENVNLHQIFGGCFMFTNKNLDFKMLNHTHWNVDQQERWGISLATKGL